VVALSFSLAGCRSGAVESPGPVLDEVRQPMGRCDPHEGPPEPMPDFVAETFGRLDATTTPGRCFWDGVARGPSGVTFPPSADWTASEISGACAVAPRECAAVCEAAVAAEVALRLFRRIQEGSHRVHAASSADRQCGGHLVDAREDALDGDAARALWACLGVPLPERVETTLTLATDPSGVRRVRDLRVRAAFAPEGAQGPSSRVHELHTVLVGSGCDIVRPRLSLVGLEAPQPGFLDDVCSEFQSEHCQVRCPDEMATRCRFVKVQTAP
jgi:hypothetical protein